MVHDAIVLLPAHCSLYTFIHTVSPPISLDLVTTRVDHKHCSVPAPVMLRDAIVLLPAHCSLYTFIYTVSPPISRKIAEEEDPYRVGDPAWMRARLWVVGTGAPFVANAAAGSALYLVRRCRLTSGRPWVEITWFQPVDSTSLSRFWVQSSACTSTTWLTSTRCAWWGGASSTPA